LAYDALLSSAGSEASAPGKEAERVGGKRDLVEASAHIGTMPPLAMKNHSTG
jgi:hypothetical protein